MAIDMKRDGVVNVGKRAQPVGVWKPRDGEPTPRERFEALGQPLPGREVTEETVADAEEETE